MKILGFNNKKIILIAALVVTMIASAAVTTAFLQANTGRLTNTFQLLGLETNIVPAGNGNWKIQNFDSIANDQELNWNTITVEAGANIPTADAIIRIRITVSPEGLNKSNLSMVTDQVNTGSWELIGEYFYYTSVVPSGGVTEPIFKKAVTGLENLDVVIHQEAIGIRPGDTILTSEMPGRFNLR